MSNEPQNNQQSAQASDTTPTPSSTSSELQRTSFEEVCQRILEASDDERPELTAEQQAERTAAHRRETLRTLFAERGKRYLNCTLKEFEATTTEQAAAVKRLTSYCKDMEANIADGVGVVLLGPSGTGKDHLLAAIMRAAVMVYGKSVKWENGMDLFGAVRDRMDTDKTEADWVKSMCRPDVLALSDPLPPFGPLSQFQANMLFRVVDGRYSRNRPTWITLNCAGRKEAEERMGAQIVDRLAHGAVVVVCNWPSYRKAGAS